MCLDVCVYTCVYTVCIEIQSYKMHIIFGQGVLMTRKDFGGVRGWWERPSVNGWQRRKHQSEGLGLPDGEAPSSYAAKSFRPPGRLLRDVKGGHLELGRERRAGTNWPCFTRTGGQKSLESMFAA